ncbi:ATP-binding protein [Brevundimonas denitrificans]|uniref:ATP-binding protein n=1 Tax=Brevundimonas denitrificans TaxID=1443434 RepID=UPI003FA3811E
MAKALPRLERALDRAATLATHVLDYGKTAEPEPERQSLPLKTAVAAAAEDAGLEPRGVRLVRRIPPGALIQADPDQLHRILVNLMRNARHAIQGARGEEAKGKVTVEAVIGPDGVILTIADDGPGIAPRVAERLFQPFVAGLGGGHGPGPRHRPRTGRQPRRRTDPGLHRSGGHDLPAGDPEGPGRALINRRRHGSSCRQRGDCGRG